MRRIDVRQYKKFLKGTKAPMATPAPAKQQTKTPAVDLGKSLSTLEEIDAGRNALESAYDLRGQLRLDIVYGSHENDRANWKVKLWQLQGRRDIATATGTSLVTAVNRLFHDALRTLNTWQKNARPAA
jgi:hypothetical protein